MCLGIPGEVMQIREENGLKFGRVRFGGISRDVCLECLPTVEVGEFVLVHVGFAISRIDRAEAARAYEALGELGMLAGELGPEPEREVEPVLAQVRGEEVG
jgi:hydrogenase expression/formation protein HypC